MCETKHNYYIFGDNDFVKETWENDENRWHKLYGPAQIYYDKNGLVSRENYYLNGNLHREDGPAIIQYNENGDAKYEHFCLNDRVLIFKSWIEKVKDKISQEKYVELIEQYGRYLL